jgi:hypothetical protein
VREKLRCHDILRVPVNATIEEIEAAHIKCVDSLVAPNDIHLRNHYDKKIEEFNAAKFDCLAWIQSPTTERLQKRVKESISQMLAPASANAMWYWPDYVFGF